MARVPCDELIDFRSPEKKCTSLQTCFTPLVPIPVATISHCCSALDFINYGSNPFDQLIEQTCTNFEAKNDPFEMVCETAFRSDNQGDCVFSPDKLEMKEYDQKNLLNTSVSLTRCVKEQFPDICASAMHLSRQFPNNSNIDLISTTHKIIDFEREEMFNDCDEVNMKETSNFKLTTLPGKLVDLPSPDFEHTKYSEKIDTKDLCDKMQVSHLSNTKSKYLNRSFSSAEELIFGQSNCIDTDKTVKDIVAERVEKCIQKALGDSRCYSSSSITNLNSSYSTSKVKLHRRSYSSSSVRDAEFISWLGLDKSRIKHRKSDFNIDVELSKFNNQCVSDVRNLSFKKSCISSDRVDSYHIRSSNLSVSSDVSPILGYNTIHHIGLYKSSEVSGTECFSQVKNMSEEVYFEANLISSKINRSTSVAGSCLLVEDEDILSTKAPWESPNAQSVSSEDCSDEFGKEKDSEEVRSVKAAFTHSTPLPGVMGGFSSKNEKKKLPSYMYRTPHARKQQKRPVHLFSNSEDLKKGPLKAILPVVEMTKLQNTRGPLPANSKTDKSSLKRNLEAKEIPSPSNTSESIKSKLVENCSQNSSLATDVRQHSILRRIVSHGNVTASTGMRKSVHESVHERSRSVGGKVDERKQIPKDHKAPRRVQSASNVLTATKEMKKSPFLKPLLRSSKIGAMQMSNSKISPNLQQKVHPRKAVSKSGKENMTL